MTDEGRENHPEQGESVPLNWACTSCGYSVEGELPEQYVTPNATFPVLMLTLTVSPRGCSLGRSDSISSASVTGPCRRLVTNV
jgi:hypothetical protein